MAKKQTAPVLTAEQIAEQEAAKIAGRTAFASRMVDKHAGRITELEGLLAEIAEKEFEVRKLATRAQSLAGEIVSSAETLLSIKDESPDEWPLPPTMPANTVLVDQRDRATKHVGRLESVVSALHQLSRYF